MNDINWMHIQKNLGCTDCQYCEDSALFNAPCCTYGGKLEINDETGECLTRKEKDQDGTG